MIKEQRQHLVESTERTLVLLDVLAEGNAKLSIGSLARRMGCSQTETRLLLVTLETRGIVEWDDTAKGYRLGSAAERLAWRLLGVMGKGKRPLPAHAAVGQPAALKQQTKRPGRPPRQLAV